MNKAPTGPLTVPQAARLIGFSHNFLGLAIRGQQLVATQVMSPTNTPEYRIKVADLRSFLQKQLTQPRTDKERARRALQALGDGDPAPPKPSQPRRSHHRTDPLQFQTVRFAESLVSLVRAAVRSELESAFGGHR